MGWKRSQLELTMERLLIEAGVPSTHTEYRFYPVRNWRFDFFWLEHRLALEVEGGQFIRGRHQRPVGFEDDCRKYSIAAILGYKVIRVTTRMIENGEALELVKQAMNVSMVDKMESGEYEQYVTELIPSDAPSGYNIICYKKGETYEGVGVPASRFEVIMWHRLKATEKDRERLSARMKAMRKEKADESLKPG